MYLDKYKIEDAFKNKERGTSRRFPENLAAYDNHFARFRTKENINILEIGVQGGGGLWAWRKYFEKAKNIVGIDINAGCKGHEDISKNVFVCIGNQEDEDFIKRVNDEHGPFDIIIDDGGHTTSQHQTSFNTLFELLSNDSLYCIEDLHTAYWPSHGGGHKAPSSTISFLSNLIDDLNARAQREANGQRQGEAFNYMERNVFSLHFYEGVAIIHKLKKGNIDNPISSTRF